MMKPAASEPDAKAPRRSRIMLIGVLAGLLLGILISAIALQPHKPAAVPVPVLAEVPTAPTPSPATPAPSQAPREESAVKETEVKPAIPAEQDTDISELKETVAASGEKEPDAAEKKIIGEAIDTGYIPPNPFDKFLGLDAMFERGTVKWKNIMEKVSRDLETNNLRDTDYLIPLLMGIRVADGVMAVKVRSVEDLNAAADDIRDMAVKLRVPERDMSWANKARAEAARGEWAGVFMSLGFMQKKVLDKLKEAKQDQRSLVMLSGWIQGLHYSATAVLDHYDAPVLKNSTVAHPSYQLRDPQLVVWLIGLAKNLSADKQVQPEVVAIRKALGEIYDILDIDIDAKKGKVSREDVEKLISLADNVISAIRAKAR